jgi:tetratricopeptide (TPR) repeat protein
MAFKEKEKQSSRKPHREISTKLGEKKSQPPAIDPKRERIFRLLALFLPVLFFLLLEGGLRLFNYGGTLELFIPASGDYAEYKMCNPKVGRRYFFMQSTVPDPPADIFLTDKPENGYRIFVLGGSTAAGYPYAENVMFSRILDFQLREVFPDKHIEVVNAAMSAVCSYTLLDFMDEILSNEPDAILIYAGHNEFYGALGVASTESLGRIRGFVKFYLELQRVKTFLLIRNGVGKLRKWINRVFSGEAASESGGTLMERVVAEQTIPYVSPIYELGKRQFAGNLRDILKKAKAAGVPVLLSEVVSNIRDHKPFVSVAVDNLPPAETAYHEARRLEQEKKFDEAKSAYYRAKDLDALRFRASEELNAIIHQVAAEFDVPVVPMKACFEAASPHGLIGANLILEHLHPNVDGYFLMASAFFDAMQRHGFISTHWDSSRIKPASFYRENWGFTELDRAYTDLRVRILKGNWPFQPKAAPNRALIDYHPATKAESLAVDIVTDKTNLEHAHVALAEYYERQRQFEKAFQEYNSLICATPYNVSAYLSAANALVNLQQYHRALPILYSSLKLEDTAFANKWIGQIYLNDGKTKEALPYLEKSLKMVPDDAQLLYNLSGAYALDAQYQKARETLARLEKIRPNFPGAADLKQQLDRL